MKSRLLGAVCTFAITLVSMSASAVLIGVNDTTLASPIIPGSVFTINTGTGVATKLSDIDTVVASAGATFLGGELYATHLLESFVSDTAYLGTIDPNTGVSTYEIPTPRGAFSWKGIASDESAGLIYTIHTDSRTSAPIRNTLLAINPSGVLTTIGSGVGDFVDGSGMAFDDQNGILYATGTDRSLYTVDTVTGTSTLIGPMVIPTTAVGLAFDESTGTLYANSGNENSLYMVDVTTGAATLIGGNGVTGISGLAWVDAVPIPPALYLFATGLIGLVGVARRRAQS